MEYEQIWAPWRLGYILGEKETPKTSPTPNLSPGGQPTCFLCHYAAAGDDQARAVVCRTPHSLTILNRYPYNNGHLLVSPRSHVGRLNELTPDEQLDLTQTISRMVLLLEKVLQPHGFNIGLNLGREAGAGVPDHLHWHIVPRWAGDTNFMTTLAGTRVIPQSLAALWAALVKELGN